MSETLTPEQVAAEAERVAEQKAATDRAAEAGATKALELQQASVPTVPRTQEELDKYLEVWKPDNTYADALQASIVSDESTPEDRITALNQMRDGIVNQTMRGAELLMDEKMEAMEKKFQPAMAGAMITAGERAWDDFAAVYPQLKEHKDLVDMVSTSLATSKYIPESKEALYEKVAEGAVGMIQKFDTSFKLDKENQQTTLPPGKMPDMVAAGSAPQGGPGVPTGTDKDNDVKNLWD